jgi:hypothetical protein
MKMPKDVDRKIMRAGAEHDQLEKYLTDFARVIVSFRDALKQNGLSRADANMITAQWLNFYWSHEYTTEINFSGDDNKGQIL